MPLFPQVEQQYTQQVVTDTFGGYDHQLKIPDGEWYDTRNLTTDYAPMLANRKPRIFTNREACALIEKKALAYIGLDGTLYFNWQPTGLTGLTVSAPGTKQLVSMGAYICIFPDKKYINTENLSDYGSMEAYFTGNATYEMVRYDGTAISARWTQAAEPASPVNGDYWIDTSGDTHVLRQWSDAQNDWVSVETVYIKITFQTMGQIPALFAELDGVDISGSTVTDVNGSKVIYDLGGDENTADWIMVTGLIDAIPADPESITISRTVPDMDFVCESQNRLWGCYYGLVDGKPVNEIYCCALGDFKNWRQYQGLSTDSWTGSVGSDGQWTGAVNYLGYPTFFKENRIHRVTISTEGAHRIDETVCRGVQKGSSKSLVVVNETLYYKSISDVCAYQGSFPQSVSQVLGNAEYSRAAAGAVNGKYVINMYGGESMTQSTFSYDITKGIWIREDKYVFSEFATVDGVLYGIENTSNEIVAVFGACGIDGTDSEDERLAEAGPGLWFNDGGLEWGALTGVQYYEYADNKRISRYNIRMKMDKGAKIAVYLRYDDDVQSMDGFTAQDAISRQESLRPWILSGQVEARKDGIGHYILPVRPRRCDHLQMLIVGKGNVRIYSIAKILEVGSDYR